MRDIDTHKVHGCGQQVAVRCGGDYYEIASNSLTLATIPFQTGTIPEKGINGATIESLIAIAHDRLSQHQSGPYPCMENAMALQFLDSALESLKNRTKDRLARQVECKHES